MFAAATVLALAAAAVSGAAEPPPAGEDLYPLPGIPEADRGYINRTYARILRATHAKLVLLKALEERRDLPAARARYEETTRSLAARLRAEPAPEGLAAFQEDVGQALALQQAFFLANAARSAPR